MTGFGSGNELIVDDVAWIRLEIVSRARLLGLQLLAIASEARIYLGIKFQIHIRCLSRSRTILVDYPSTLRLFFYVRWPRAERGVQVLELGRCFYVWRPRAERGV